MAKLTQFIRQTGASDPRARIFCFPFAGGSPSVFSSWGRELGPRIEVFAAHPGGRGMRFRECPMTTVEAMVEEYLRAVRLHLDLPYVLYGHSLGGLIAFDIARILEAENLRPPERLFLGASAPPHLGLIHEPIHHLPDAGFVDALQQRYGGIPAEVLREPELLAMFLPALKADFTAYELYRFAAGDPVNCPMTVFAGERDPGITPELLAEWSRHTRKEFVLQPVAGDHFFLAESGAIVLASIRRCLESETSSNAAVSDLAWGY